MSLKFEPDMFPNRWILEEQIRAANIAQAKFDKWLSEQPVAKGYSPSEGHWVVDTLDGGSKPTHTARLVCIEPIEKKCEHRTKRMTYKCGENFDYDDVECMDCGAKLKASWQVVE